MPSLSSRFYLLAVINLNNANIADFPQRSVDPRGASCVYSLIQGDVSSEVHKFKQVARIRGLLVKEGIETFGILLLFRKIDECEAYSF